MFVRMLFIATLLILPFPLAASCPQLSEAVSEEVHSRLTHRLFRGQILSEKRFSANNNATEIYLLKVAGAPTQNTLEAIFKPRRWGDGGGFSRTPMEYVAYWLNRKLDMDFIPPTAYRRSVKVGHETLEGAIIYFTSPEISHKNHRKLPDLRDKLSDQQFKKLLGFSKEAVFSDSRILNVMLQNRDAHLHNLLVGRHWVTGAPSPVFIDFGASLHPAPGGPIRMDDYQVYRNSAPVLHIRERTLRKLKSLNLEQFKEVREFVTEEEAAHMLQIRDGILNYYKLLIEEKGAANVILPE